MTLTRLLVITSSITLCPGGTIAKDFPSWVCVPATVISHDAYDTDSPPHFRRSNISEDGAGIYMVLPGVSGEEIAIKEMLPNGLSRQIECLGLSGIGGPDNAHYLECAGSADGLEIAFQLNKRTSTFVASFQRTEQSQFLRMDVAVGNCTPS